MTKTIWSLNHYAGNMYLVGGGRHYYFAKYLKEYGFNPIVFCSNYDHFTHKKCIDNDASWFEREDSVTGVPYIFIRTREYLDNGIQRVFNMFDFYFGVIKSAKTYAESNGRPDIIYASSVHPMTLVAGIKLAKYFGVKCISEVRDLWPESIVAYSSKWKRTNPLMKVLYAGEKWIYKKSDYVIMTWAGGYDYIIDQGWQKVIPESKVIHISNGVDLEPYYHNMHENHYMDDDLSNTSYKNFIYTGSVRKVNNLAILVAAAEKLKELGNKSARLLIYGDGDELENLKTVAFSLDNIIFKGRVSKQCVPSILSQGYASILHNSSTDLDKYGQSQNKFFEYLAAGRPILMTYSVGHSTIRANGCGVELETQTPEAIAEAITSLCNLTENEYQVYCKKSIECAEKYDYKELSRQLISVINKCMYT